MTYSEKTSVGKAETEAAFIQMLWDRYNIKFAVA